MEPAKFGWLAARTREDRSGPLRGIWPTILTIKGLGTQSLGGCRPQDPQPYLGCLPPVGSGGVERTIFEPDLFKGVCQVWPGSGPKPKFKFKFQLLI